MKARDHFSWHEDDVVIEHVDALAVYINVSDDIVIRRESYDEDNVVAIPRGRVREVLTAIARVVGIEFNSEALKVAEQVEPSRGRR